MANFNKNMVIFAGRLTADPELRQTQTGSPVAIFNVAAHNVKKQDNQNIPDAEFVRFTAFDKTAQFVATYFRKGSSIFVEGKITNNNYTDKNGQKHYDYRFIANHVDIVDSKQEMEQMNAMRDTPNQGYQTYANPYNGGNGNYTPSSYNMNQAPQNNQSHMEPIGEDSLPF